MTMLPQELIDSLDDPQAFMDELCRKDFTLFLQKAFSEVSGGAALKWNWHLDAIAFQLNQVQQGKILRLLVTLPPRNLKSIAISVAWVAWMMGQNPTHKFVCVSYSGELSDKLARMCLSLMQCTWYRRLFPKTIISSKRSATHDFETTAGGMRLATSITGTLTGRGGSFIIIDDPIKPDEALSDTTRNKVNEWYRTTLSSRLDDKENGALICVMQRLHAYDLAGQILEDGGWEHLNLPAIAIADQRIPLTRGRAHKRHEGDLLHPERESDAVLQKLKAQMGSAIFSAQYQQDPVPPEGNMVEREWLLEYESNISLESGRIVQSWDTASKDGIHNDYCVCITALIKDKEAWIIDVYREKHKFPDLKKAAIRLAREYTAHIMLIEDAASGTQLYQSLRNERPHGVPLPIKQLPDQDKKTRFSGVTHMIEAGQLLLPKEAPWLLEFHKELLGFPNARHDDQVDALSHLLHWLDRQQRRNCPPVPPTVYTEDGYTDETGFHPYGSEDRYERDFDPMDDVLY